MTTMPPEAREGAERAFLGVLRERFGGRWVIVRPGELELQIIELLGDGKWRTAREISSKSKGGVGARLVDVEACLEENRVHRFRSTPGTQHGRSAKATVWQLASLQPIEDPEHERKED